MGIEELSNKYEKEWDNFVINHPNGTVYHQNGWKNLIIQTYNHTPKYYFYKKDGKIIGIIPLFIINSLFKKVLVSIPYCPYGGVLAYDNEIRNFLIEKAIKLTKDLNLGYMELRERNIKGYELDLNDIYVSFILKLPKDEITLWNSISSSTRRHIRMAEKYNYEIQINDDINTFYNLYSRHMRNVGTPSLGIKFFKNLKYYLNKNFIVATILYNKIPVSSILLLIYKDIIIYDRGASRNEFKNLNLNYVLFWKIICKFIKHDYNYFDFGRSIPGSGTYQFKNGWRPEILNLNYLYFLNTTNRKPNISQNSTKRKVFKIIWRHIPLKLTDNLGYGIRKLYP